MRVRLHRMLSRKCTFNALNVMGMTLALFLTCGSVRLQAQTSPEAGLEPSSLPTPSAAWRAFEATWPASLRGRLPDFSFAGYEYQEEPIPDIVGPIYLVSDYGAIPNDGISDHFAIQAAFKAAASRGGGVVLFGPGEFLTHTADDPIDPIILRGSNVVLRGSGRTETWIVQELPARVNPRLGFFQISFGPKGGGKRQARARILQNAYRGQFSVVVSEPDLFDVGEWVLVDAKVRSPEVFAQWLQPYPLGRLKALFEEGMTFREPHQIVAIHGNQLVFREPLMIDEINVSHARWAVVQHNMASNIGVEDIGFLGFIPAPFVHHGGHDSTWSALRFQSVAHSFIRRVTFRDVSRAITLGNSAAVTVSDVLVEGNGGHYNVKIKGGRGNLVTNVRDTANQYHGLGLSHGASGHVFKDSVMNVGQHVDVHKTNPSRNNLYDAVVGGQLHGSSGGGVPPRHLRGLTFWNFTLRHGLPMYSYKFDVQTFVTPHIVGMHGDPFELDPESTGIVELVDTGTVEPRSLFEAQVKLRLSRTRSRN